MKNIRFFIPSFLIVLAFAFLDKSSMFSRVIFGALGILAICSAVRFYHQMKGNKHHE